MQFKHPEILYGLLLLLIPIIVHLFQLRRFQKEDFTNVKFLKAVTLQTRKSSQLKKWLTLLARLGLMACAVLAFAQPYFSNSESFNTKSETVIYLDNSFSMQAKGKNGTLLNEAIQSIFENIPDTEEISIYTNDNSFKNSSLKAIRNQLITLKHVPKQLSYDAAVLTGKQLFSEDKSSLKNLILVSDFQQQKEPFSMALDSTIQTTLIPLEPSLRQNVSIDSLYISKTNGENLELTVDIENSGEPIENLSISLFNADKLIAKSSVEITEKASTLFTIPINTKFEGKITIEDSNLLYDNSFYFSLDKNDLIKVLSINEANDDFLKKIYTNDEFVYTSFALKDFNYNSINDKNLIILNELSAIPNAMITALNAFVSDGGNILIIPSDEISLNTYNQIFNSLNLDDFTEIKPSEKRVTTINYAHPLLTNVFDKRVDNFQYPKVNSFYPSSANISSSILGFEDGSAFLIGTNNVYAFSAALNKDNSNFKSSPLIVPVLYNIAKRSLALPRLYYTVGNENTIAIKAELQQDDILKLVSSSNSSENNISIPLQRTFTNKVELTTNEFPETSGWVAVTNKDETVKSLSYNYDRTESQLSYINLDNVKNVTIKSSIATAISDIKSATNVNELWKWFVIFALVFLAIEVLLLKFLK